MKWFLPKNEYCLKYWLLLAAAALKMTWISLHVSGFFLVPLDQQSQYMLFVTCNKQNVSLHSSYHDTENYPIVLLSNTLLSLDTCIQLHALTDSNVICISHIWLLLPPESPQRVDLFRSQSLSVELTAKWYSFLCKFCSFQNLNKCSSPFSILFPLLSFSSFALWFRRFLSQSFRIKCLCPCLVLRTSTSAFASTPTTTSGTWPTPASFFSPTGWWWRSPSWRMPSGQLFILLGWPLEAIIGSEENVGMS